MCNLRLCCSGCPGPRVVVAVAATARTLQRSLQANAIAAAEIAAAVASEG